MPEPEAPKIIVDTDWKSQAQAEKERLAAAEKAKAAELAGTVAVAAASATLEVGALQCCGAQMQVDPLLLLRARLVFLRTAFANQSHEALRNHSLK